MSKLYLVLFLSVYAFCQSLSANLDFHRNPFQPLLSEDLSYYLESFDSKQKLDIELRGIIWDDYLPMAVVAVQGVHKSLIVGDFFLGYELIKIEKTSILLKDKKGSISLELGLSYSTDVIEGLE